MMTRLEKLQQQQETIRREIEKEKALELDRRLRESFRKIIENELPASEIFQRLLAQPGVPVALDRFAQELESMVKGYLSRP